jgi:hypothetical protein
VETSESECLDALREAAERLGESPTKQQYEDLGLRPAASTVIRVVGGGTRPKNGPDWRRIHRAKTEARPFSRNRTGSN